MKKITTLLFVIKNGKVLLGMKKRGFGMGRWNGFGGKKEQAETIEQSAIRETFEECGIEALAIEKIGILEFEFAEKPEWNQQVHFFSTSKFEGKPEESEEMRPGWFAFEKIPYAKMWPDDKIWMPMMLFGKKFQGRFVFGPNDSILEYEISETEIL